MTARPAGPGVGPLMADVRDLRQLVANTAIDELPALVGRLVELEECARLRLRSEANGGDPLPAPAASEVWLTPDEALAVIGGVSRKWLLRHTKGLRFRRDLSRKVVRFERIGLLRWIASTRA